MKMNRRHPRFVLRRRSFGGLRGGSDSWACEWGVFSWSLCDLGCLAIWMQFCERQQCREEVCRRHVPAPSEQRVAPLSFLPSAPPPLRPSPGIKASLWGRERENRTDAARPHARNIHGSWIPCCHCACYRNWVRPSEALSVGHLNLLLLALLTTERGPTCVPRNSGLLAKKNKFVSLSSMLLKWFGVRHLCSIP